MDGDHVVTPERHQELGGLDDSDRPPSKESRELRQASSGRLIFIIIEYAFAV
jgi:hypothetical protein